MPCDQLQLYTLEWALRALLLSPMAAHLRMRWASSLVMTASVTARPHVLGEQPAGMSYGEMSLSPGTVGSGGGLG